MNFIKEIFLKNNIFKKWDTADEEALKQWVLKHELTKNIDKESVSIEKAKAAIEAMLNGNPPEGSDAKAFVKLHKKYKNDFYNNKKQLESPTREDSLNMSSITLDEIGETVDDKKRIIFYAYRNAILEIYRSSEQGNIITPTSGGLFKSNTPTSDFVDGMPEFYNPLDDALDD